MTVDTFTATLARGAERLTLDVNQVAMSAFARYYELLVRWNRTHRLVADVRPELVAEVHFLDSLALLRLLPPEPPVIVDLGSGAGFPGIVLAIALPDRRFVLVEPLHKRVAFLHALRVGLGLGNIAIEPVRSTALSDRSAAALVTRATLPPAMLIQEATRLLAPGGWLIAMTARGLAASEVTAAHVAGFSLQAQDAFALPFSGASRTNVLLSSEVTDVG